MALEPAIGVILGLLVLHQGLSIIQILGISLVVLAGAAAQSTGRRRPSPIHDSKDQHNVQLYVRTRRSDECGL